LTLSYNLDLFRKDIETNLHFRKTGGKPGFTGITEAKERVLRKTK
jgi:hypothetical protein